MKNSFEIYNYIYNEILKMTVIDTHEHLLWDEKSIENQDNDFFKEYLCQYLSSDIISSGLSRDDFEKVTDVKRDIEERWKIVEPFWEFSRYTGYGRAVDISVRAIYGVDGVNGGTIAELNKKFLENKKFGHYTYVLKDLCNIETSLLDDWTSRFNVENQLFTRVWQPNIYVTPSFEFANQLKNQLESDHKISVKTLDDWLDGIEKELDYVLILNNNKILKCASAYSRSLRYEKTEYKTARELFSDALAKFDAPDESKYQSAFPKPLQDYIMHHLFKLADKRGLTYQFHTGLLEGNGNTITNSDPALLTNVFLEYPNVKFDLFHISYPYQTVAAAICKMFPNVFIDMCWAHIMSPYASVEALNDFLDAVPYNKISAFGGDYCFADAVYGHLYLARQNVARTLAGKVELGVFSEDKAVDIAKALFYDNPKRIFQLESHKQGGI